MASVVTAVLNATLGPVGLLVNKGRDLAANKLKEGDVTDEKFRNMIVRELDDIRSKLDGLTRKGLLTSISFFKEGIVFLYKVLDKNSCGKEGGTATEQGTVTQGTREGNSQLSLRTLNASFDQGSLLRGMETLDDSGKRALADAKKRFDDARMKATEAFNNVALSTSDRILAMQYRVMSTILEKIDNPKEAMASCRLCLEELHSIPAVQNSFKVGATGGFWSLFNKVEREEIIKSVHDVNRVILKVTEVTDGVLSRDFDTWPYVNIGGGEVVDPLIQHAFNSRVRVLPWSFGQEGEDEHKLKCPKSITTNTQGQFLVADNDDVKVFDCRGKFLCSFKTIPDADYKLTKLEGDDIRVWDVATDRDDNVYLLSNSIFSSRIYVFDEQGNMCHKFDLKGSFHGSLVTVNENKKVIVLGREYDSCHATVQVYESDGRFVNSLGHRDNLRLPPDTHIATAGDNQIMAFTDCKEQETSHVVFYFQRKFTKACIYPRPVPCCYKVIGMTFHLPTEHILIVKQQSTGLGIDVYTKHFRCVRHIYRDTEKLRSTTTSTIHVLGITVTADGRIAVLCTKEETESKHQKHVVLVV